MQKAINAQTNGNVQAFLTMIRQCEHNRSDDYVYHVLFGGGYVEDLSKHLNKCVPFRNTCSTAQGAYQFLYRTYKELATLTGRWDMSKETQDLFATILIAREGALEDVIAGRFTTALDKVQNIWASLPDVPGGERDANYGQPRKTVDYCITYYKKAGGLIAA